MCSYDVTAAMLEEQTKKREIFFWGLNSVFMQIPPFVSDMASGHMSEHTL